MIYFDSMTRTFSFIDQREFTKSNLNPKQLRTWAKTNNIPFTNEAEVRKIYEDMRKKSGLNKIDAYKHAKAEVVAQNQGEREANTAIKKIKEGMDKANLEKSTRSTNVEAEFKAGKKVNDKLKSELNKKKKDITKEYITAKKDVAKKKVDAAIKAKKEQKQNNTLADVLGKKKDRGGRKSGTNASTGSSSSKVARKIKKVSEETGRKGHNDARANLGDKNGFLTPQTPSASKLKKEEEKARREGTLFKPTNQETPKSVEDAIRDTDNKSKIKAVQSQSKNSSKKDETTKSGKFKLNKSTAIKAGTTVGGAGLGYGVGKIGEKSIESKLRKAHPDWSDEQVKAEAARKSRVLKVATTIGGGAAGYGVGKLLTKKK